MNGDATSDVADELDPLTRLAIRHGTDKWGPHFYTPVYHTLFAHLRDKPVRLLEIGIGGYTLRAVGGASLAMWAEYFPHGRIVGIDIVEKKLDLGPRVKIRCGSQDDAAFLASVSEEDGPFDIVIDDGSHVPAHVVASFLALFPRLSDGALYVIEDTQTAFFPQFGGSEVNGGATMEFAATVLAHLNHAEIKIVQPALQVDYSARKIRSLRAYHNIIVIEKGDNDEPSNFAYRLDNPHAARAVRLIEQELARAPTAAGFANLADIYVLAGESARAEALALEALRQWPDHPTLLASAFRATLDAQRRLAIAGQLAGLDPEGARPFVEEAAAELASAPKTG